MIMKTLVAYFSATGTTGVVAPSAPGAEVINGDILNGDKSDDELKAFAEKYI